MNKYKHLTLALLWTLFMCNLLAGSSKPSRQALQILAESGDAAAQGMLDAIRGMDRGQLRTHAKMLVAEGHLDQVIPLLFDPSDVVKQELVATLAEAKEKQVVVALVDSYAQLDVLITGGTEAQILRKETKTAFEDVLERATGLKVEPEWTHKQRVQAFRDAIRRSPE